MQICQLEATEMCVHAGGSGICWLPQYVIWQHYTLQAPRSIQLLALSCISAWKPLPADQAVGAQSPCCGGQRPYDLQPRRQVGLACVVTPASASSNCTSLRMLDFTFQSLISCRTSVFAKLKSMVGLKLLQASLSG